MPSQGVRSRQSKRSGLTHTHTKHSKESPCKASHDSWHGSSKVEPSQTCMRRLLRISIAATTSTHSESCTSICTVHTPSQNAQRACAGALAGGTEAVSTWKNVGTVEEEHVRQNEDAATENAIDTSISEVGDTKLGSARRICVLMKNTKFSGMLHGDDFRGLRADSSAHRSQKQECREYTRSKQKIISQLSLAKHHRVGLRERRSGGSA